MSSIAELRHAAEQLRNEASAMVVGFQEMHERAEAAISAGVAASGPDLVAQAVELRELAAQGLQEAEALHTGAEALVGAYYT